MCHEVNTGNLVCVKLSGGEGGKQSDPRNNTKRRHELELTKQ